MGKFYGRVSIDDILEETLRSGPAVAIKSLRTRLSLENAEHLAGILRQRHGMDIQPFDFPRTMNVWQSESPEGIPYKRIATTQLIKLLAEEKGVDYRTVEGFKEILPLFVADTFRYHPINQFGTRLQGMLVTYENSPFAAVLDVVSHDTEFLQIRKAGLQPYDFPEAPRNTWQDEAGNPTPMARHASKQLIRAIAAQQKVDYRTIDGFRQILPLLTQRAFLSMPINIWGTTLSGMFQHAYHSNHSEAVMDLVDKDEEFLEIRLQGLNGYDFSEAPNGTWVDNAGKPTATARAAFKELIKGLAAKQGVDYRTIDGFRSLLPLFTSEVFKSTPINLWGTTLGGAFSEAYHSRPTEPIFDLINQDQDFEAIQKEGLQDYDFPFVPKSTWTYKKRPTNMARAATKRLITVLAEEMGLDYRTESGFRELMPHLTQDAFREVKLNQWGTTLSSQLANAYENSPSRAVHDLIKKDPEFAHVQRKITRQDIKRASLSEYRARK